MARDMLRLAIRGDLRAGMKAERRAINKAMIRALREGSTELRQAVRADTSRALGRKVGAKWRNRVFVKGRKIGELAALVYPKGGPNLRGMLHAHEEGVTIRPKRGRFLAIPTGFNRAGGRRGARVLFEPGKVPGGFVKKSRGGNLFVFAPINRATTFSQGIDKQSGRTVNNARHEIALVGNQTLASGRRRRSASILAAGIVPMFLLRRSVRIKKSTARAHLARRAAQALPGRFVRHLEQTDAD